MWTEEHVVRYGFVPAKIIDVYSSARTKMRTAICAIQAYLRTVTDDDIQFAQSRINNRPKKCLGFKQPAVIFKEMAMAA